MKPQINNISIPLAEKQENEKLIDQYIKTNWQTFTDPEIEILKRRRRQRRARATAAAIISCRQAG